MALFDQQQEELSKEQKIAFSFLLLIGVLTIGLGFLQIRNNIFGPFVIKPDFNSGPSAAQFFKDEQTRLQKIDTDKDGLNDYAEINFHNTSRYISDSDSDGIDDGEEVEQGTDPLCPEGEKCNSEFSQEDKDSKSIRSPVASTTPSAADIIGNATREAQKVKENLDKTSGNNTTSSLENSESSNQPNKIESLLQNPDKLRAAMKKNSNIPPEKIDQIDDQTLIKAAKELLKQQNNQQ